MPAYLYKYTKKCPVSAFAIPGDSIFDNVFNARFVSFQILGGIVLLFTGLPFVFKGNASIESLHGESKHIAGAIAMPILSGLSFWFNNT